MRATTRHEAISELVDLAVAQTRLSERDALIEAIESRELTGPTALGPYAAFPHARTDLTDQLYVVLGVAPHGVAWTAKNVVRLIFLFVTPRRVTTSYINTLAALSELLHRPGVPEAIVAAPNIQAVVDVIRATRVRITVFHRAKDIMVREVVTVSPQTTVRTAAHLLGRHNISGMPVVDADRRVLGILSEKDLLVVGMPKLAEFFGAQGFHATSDTIVDRLLGQEDILVGDIMNSDIVCVDENASVTEVAQLLVARNIRRAPVVRDGKLVGIVSRANILRDVIRRVGVA